MSQQWLYVVVGSVMTMLNAPIVCTVLKYKVLRQRKEYIIFAGTFVYSLIIIIIITIIIIIIIIIISGLASADLLAGIATLEAGVYRLLVESKPESIPRSRCALIPHTWLFLFASPAQVGRKSDDNCL